MSRYDLAMVKAKVVDPLAQVKSKAAQVKSVMLNPAASRNDGLGVYEPPPTLPSELLACTNLERLEVLRGVIAGPVPGGLGKLRKLTRLALGGFAFDALPASLGDLVKLEVLELDYADALATLPSTIAKLGKLREL